MLFAISSDLEPEELSSWLLNKVLSASLVPENALRCVCQSCPVAFQQSHRDKFHQRQKMNELARIANVITRKAGES
ncbi:hypothetical protein O9929_13390 [Vibrio lentus]|nr:hypothetical protein [Vibrio lentus]